MPVPVRVTTATTKSDGDAAVVARSATATTPMDPPFGSLSVPIDRQESDRSDREQRTGEPVEIGEFVPRTRIVGSIIIRS